jgi:hypothetical protein
MKSKLNKAVAYVKQNPVKVALIATAVGIAGVAIYYGVSGKSFPLLETKTAAEVVEVVEVVN